MRKLILLLPLLFAVACQSGGSGDRVDEPERPTTGPRVNDDEEGEVAAIILERSDVQRFRGSEMVKLLARMDSERAEDWQFVRRHVHPRPQSPREGKFTWPPENPDKMNDRQRAWHSYLLWPAHVRALLHSKEWDSKDNRVRLARYGRMYSLLHEFQTRSPHRSPTQEAEYWRQFAESMLAYGADGEELLIANMIVAFSNPTETVVYQAQNILLQLGDAAIEPLCAAMWTSHRQLVMGWEEEIDERTGKRIRTDVIKAVGNPNYNRYIADTLFRIGPRAIPKIINELEISVDDDGFSRGPAWRFRRYFVELLGRFGDRRALRTLEGEIDRVIVEEYVLEELYKGRRVIDRDATEDGAFVFREYIIQAIARIPDTAGLRPIIKLWEMDESHEIAAATAIQRLTKRRVTSPAEARQLAINLGVKLD